MKSYERVLDELIDDLYADAFERMDWTWAQFAEKANLCYGNVCRLGYKQTTLPRFQTIYKLARALGREVIIETVLKHYQRKAG